MWLLEDGGAVGDWDDPACGVGVPVECGGAFNDVSAGDFEGGDSVVAGAVEYGYGVGGAGES